MLVLLPHLAVVAFVGSSARLSRHATRPRPLGGSMSLPLDSSLIIDTVSPAIERRMQALACAVPVAISVLATRSSSGIPQIAEVMGQTKSKTPSQVATKWGPRVFFGDAVVYMSRFIYHMRRGYPLACWSELIPLMLQNVICFYLTRSQGSETDEPNGENEGALARPWARRADQWLKLVLDAAFLAALGLLMLRLPTRLMPLLCLWSVPLSISSYTVQALETVRMGPRSTSRSGWALRIRWVGSLVRVVTTACFLGGDLAALSNHAVGFLGCSTLLQQRSAYEREGPTKQQTRYALYAQLSSTREREKAPRSSLPPILDAVLHAWRSLGGFGSASPPASSDVLWSGGELDRRAFDAIDEDGSGFISEVELTDALMQASGLVAM